MKKYTSRFLLTTLCKWLSMIVIAVSITGCQTLGYYMQLGQGHMGLMLQRESIEDVINDPGTDPVLKAQLSKVSGIREFASTTLSLPDNGSYTSYVELGREAVVWNVVAAPQFSVEPKTWCFPITGCVSYRGYFDYQEARQFADELQQQGFDTYLAEAAAYSTLGWFSDPILSTFVNRSEPALAGLIFHELAHQEFFMSGDTAFNESFATAVQIEGVRLWLQQNQQPDQIERYLKRLALGRDFVNTMLDCKQRFREYYQTTAQPTIEGKQSLFSQCQTQDYQAFKGRWNGFEGYDDWVEQLNNAKLVSLGDYNQWVEAFSQLLKNQSMDFEAFYREVKELAELDRQERIDILSALAEQAASVEQNGY